jgi:quinol monooxygenase YgiN
MMPGMSILVHAEIHGLSGRASELRSVLGEHTTAMRAAPGCLSASASEPLGEDLGEILLLAWWEDEAALRAHYATREFARYVSRVGELLARPSDVQVLYVDRAVRAEADLSADPTRQG